jgi:hypothetical protein
LSFPFCLVLDTEDDSLLDFAVDGSSSEGQKTPTLTPRKSILKTKKVNEREIFFFLFNLFFSFFFSILGFYWKREGTFCTIF